jgi:hypothetical protein
MIWLVIGALLWSVTGVRADEAPPAADRPADFSGAAGVYEIESHAAPTELKVEEPLILTVTIKGKAAGDYPPPKHIKPAFLGDLETDFQVDDLPEKDSQPDVQTWIYYYRLRPRSTQVKKIPRLKFVYWDPQSDSYARAYSSSIPLQVHARPKVPPANQVIDTSGHLVQR